MQFYVRKLVWATKTLTDCKEMSLPFRRAVYLKMKRSRCHPKLQTVRDPIYAASASQGLRDHMGS